MATDTVEAIVAEMRAGAVELLPEPAPEVIRAWADRLQSAHDAEARDARRYRWLQSGPTRPCGQPCAYRLLNDKLQPIGREELDAAIDRAMEGEDG